MLYMLFALLFLNSLSLNGVAMMQHGKIQPPDKNTQRPSPNVNKPNPNLPGLSVHGKQIEENMIKKMDKHLLHAEVGHERSFNFWHEKNSAEAARNRKHKVMQLYNDQINEHEKEKKTLIGKVISKLPTNVKKEKELRTNFGIYKQAREESREKMRNLIADANLHKKHGNFIDHDVQYITQPFNDESYQLGFRSDGRHILSPQNSPTGSPRQSTSHHGSHKLTRDRSGPSRSTASH